MRYNLTFLIVILLIVFSSCRKDFTSTLSSGGELTFSKDTVYLDTVFTNIGTSTYNLKVYNKSGNDISIPTIALGRGENSFYRLNVDGIPGKSFENVEILAKDSIFIFIETTIDYNNVVNPIYIDSIVFNSTQIEQNVKLVTLVEDANFLFPSKSSDGIIETIKTGIDDDGSDITVQGFYLGDNTTFTNNKPTVIYGYCAVPEDKTLTIEAGARIHFHANSGLIVDKNATLTIEGELDNQVILEGDRLEPYFTDVPGQWGTIWLRAGSKNNNIENAIIKNASIGVIIDSIGSVTEPALTLKNTQIYNSSNYGLLGRQTNIYGENVVINNSGLISLACTIGGNYNFTHSTFANYWSSSLREYPSVLINNYYSYYNENGTEIYVVSDLNQANFTNCIIDGNSNIELLIDKIEGSQFNYDFKNNLIRFNDYNNNYEGIAEYNFEDTTHFLNNIINGEADFKNSSENELIIGENSEANGNALETASNLIPLDILGVTRTIPADIGAYQHITFEEE
ncbi:hypothetical protein R3X25_14955 [Lutibacter sp. TH_r2]|uniref:hypothetical protein n=1 Tax=Lutibacter sp. TH_r2 TaxID=3082083 RepID=UPI0029541B71|nr:hypothetical protein [Lutibacter sp. TH_r2]MDV7188584.1 hypothetical protein [Lutibacter sp. TH_r2]